MKFKHITCKQLNIHRLFSFQEPKFAGKAVEDFSEVLDRDNKFYQAFERRAEVFIILKVYELRYS